MTTELLRVIDASKRHLGGMSLYVFSVLVAILTGCSNLEYKRQADEENYAIIRAVEEQVFGRTNDFTIDTKYSGRDPQEIPASELIEDRRSSGEVRLDLDSALVMAYGNSRTYQREKEDLYLAALSLSNQRNVFGSIWSGRINPNVEREADGDVRLESATSLGISKRLYRTGGTITANFANDLLRFVTGDPRRSLANALTISFTQPLLRGRGKYNATADRLTQAERDVIYAMRDYTQFQKTFAVDVVNDYYTLLGSKNTIRNNYANYLRGQESTRRAQARQGVDSKRNFDLALQQELVQKNAYIDSIVRYQNALDRFKDRLGIPISKTFLLDDQPFTDLEKVGLVPVDLSAEQAYAIAVTNHLPTLNEIDRYQDSKRRILVAANALRPGLDITSSSSLNWDREENYQSFDVDEVRANMGLILDLPLNRVNERNSYRSALINFERQLRSLQQTLDDRRRVIQEALRTLDQTRKNFQNFELGVAIAERRVEELELRLAAGSVDQQSYIDAQNSLIDQQNRRINAIVSYLRTRLQLLIDIGTLDSVGNRFWLAEGSEPAATPPAAVDPNAAASSPVVTPEELFQEEPAPSAPTQEQQ